MALDCTDLGSYYLAGYGYRVEGLVGGDTTADVDVITTRLGFGTAGGNAYPIIVTVNAARTTNPTSGFTMTVQGFCCKRN